MSHRLSKGENRNEMPSSSLKSFWSFTQTSSNKKSSYQKNPFIRKVIIINKKKWNSINVFEMLSHQYLPVPWVWHPMGREGLEPATRWLRVSCSTNWANGPYQKYFIILALRCLKINHSFEKNVHFFQLRNWRYLNKTPFVSQIQMIGNS